MSDVPIDLIAERNKRAAPDAEFVRKDDFGREMFCFALAYDMDGHEYSLEVWAYDRKDAEKRATAMSQGLRVDGQIFRGIPA